jgi:ParB/RepB/Spo0J family partition protein
MIETVTILPLSRLHESPTNPRKTFGDAGLQELAESINSQGLLQPIVVRPVIDADGEDRPEYEIVFGHRRFRAAHLAGLGEMPCIVRALDDETAAIAQLHENLEREDIHPIEEAEGFQQLMDDHGVSADQLAMDTGKSRSYIYARLKLATLTPEVRSACMSSLIGTEVATLIARVPQPLQHLALKRCTYNDHMQAGAPQVVRSSRDCREQLRAAFTADLSAAPWSLTDYVLLPSAGACRDCPHRSNNDPALADLGDDVCTNVDCYQAKTAALQQREIEQARVDGRLIKGDFDRAHYTQLDDVAWKGWVDGGVFKRITYRAEIARLDAAGAACPMVHLVVQLNGKTIECLSKASAEAIDRDCNRRFAAEVTHAAAPEGGRGDSADGYTRAKAEPETALDPKAAAVLKSDSWLAVRLTILGRVSAQPRTLDDLRLLVQREIELTGDFGLAETVLGWTDEINASDDSTAWRLAKIAEMTADELGALLVMIAIDDATTPWGAASCAATADRRLSLARRYGVDVLAAAGKTDQTDDAGPERDPRVPDMFEGSDA